jgi:hypothetical protein
LDSDLDFELLREGYAKELQARLDALKQWELSRDEPADGISIEYQLNWIARYSGAKTQNLFHGIANYLDWKLGPKERIVVRELLRKIEKDRPWHGVDLGRVFDHRSDRRNESEEPVPLKQAL